MRANDQCLSCCDGTSFDGGHDMTASRASAFATCVEAGSECFRRQRMMAVSGKFSEQALSGVHFPFRGVGAVRDLRRRIRRLLRLHTAVRLELTRVSEKG